MRYVSVLSGLILVTFLAFASPAGAAPVVIWASDPIRPGEVVVVQGGRWGMQPQVELSTLDDSPAAKPVADAAVAARNTEPLVPLQSSEDSLKFLVPASWKSGLYRLEIVAGGVKSAPFLLNAPDAWWQQGDGGKEASPGGWLRIFGKCLSFNERASVALQGRSEWILKPKQQDCWSLRINLPEDLLNRG